MNRQSPLVFTTIFTLPLAVVAGCIGGGWWNFTAPALAFVFIPILDRVVGLDTRNVPPGDEERVAAMKTYRYVTFAAVPVQVALTLWGAWVVTRGEMTAVELAGFVLSLGVSNGTMGINVAHEFLHRGGERERMLGRFLLVTVGYMHWALEHVAVHHANVATPRDPATSRLGESFYAFWPRTVFGAFAGAWRLEGQRLDRAGDALWGAQNRVIQYIALEFLFMMALGTVFGPLALPFYLIESVIAFTMLELVNYVEHYGLERRKTGPDVWERVTPLHSWNSAHRITNHLLFNLQRHADHHFDAGRRYQILRHHDGSPQLPAGYAEMVVVALVPPLWRRVMDPLVAAHRRRLEPPPSWAGPAPRTHALR